MIPLHRRPWRITDRKFRKKNVYLQSKQRKAYACPQENRRPGFPEHRLPGTLVLAQRELHQREQRRGEDQPPGRCLLLVHDQELLPCTGPLQLALRDGRVHHRRNLPDGQFPGVPVFDQGDGGGQEAHAGRQSLPAHLRAHRPPAGGDGLSRRHFARERVRRGTPALRQRGPFPDGPELSLGRPDI